jgi:phosphoglycerol transferase MdoB-like AlkP superfamily enzyme
MIWTGGAIAQGGVEIDTYASQADLAATLLSQLGIAHDDFAFSHDILNQNTPHFAFWSYNNAFGIIDAEGHTIFDCTRNATIEQSGESSTTERQVRNGKAIVQSIHQDIRKR